MTSRVRAIAIGVSMKEVQEWLGHSVYSTTANIYAHLEFSFKVTSANRMNEVIKIVHQIFNLLNCS
ncbi:hypothetical protein CD191_19490 [Paenibacillus odorifer]|uniref:Tyr recombinase domain-containing protein n=1 Tax=Paenibacillus odorifer TaxID=189426 RepID=A0AAD0KPU7_9BACL|nr:hypothetical protein CD191_19490 [Paenibacillus odorifer]